MLSKFHAFIFALSAIFILSCNQNSEVKGDNPKENKVPKEEVTNTKNEKADNVQKWAIKTDPDGTITKVNREAADGSFIRPDGFEWEKVQEERPSKYLREPEGGETTLVEGYNKDGQEQEILVYMEGKDEEELKDALWTIDMSRVDAIRALSEHMEMRRDKDVDAKTTRITMNGEFFKGEVKGHKVTITVRSETEDEEVTEPQGASQRIYESASAMTDDIKIIIEIDEDKLDLHIRTEEPGRSDGNEQYIFEAKIIKKISGDTYPTSQDFFKKLSDLGIIGERWNPYTKRLYPYGYSFYFYVPRI